MYFAGLMRPTGYPKLPSLAPHPHHLPSSSAPQRPYSSSANIHAATHMPAPGSSAMRADNLHRPAAAAAASLPASPPAQRPLPASAHTHGQSGHQLLPQPAATGPPVPDILSILRNAGAQNPLAGLQASLAAAAAAAAPASADGQNQTASQEDAGRTASAGVKGSEDVVGSGAADVADAGPVLAGDDSGRGAPDVSNNLLALLSQLAPAGQ